MNRPGSVQDDRFGWSRQTSIRPGLLRRGLRLLLLVVEKVRVGVAVGADRFRHRVVSLNEQVSGIVPGECFYAVSHFDVWLRAEVLAGMSLRGVSESLRAAQWPTWVRRSR